MSLRRRLAATSVVLGLAFGVVAMAGGPALGDCGLQTGHFCAYRDANYGTLLLHSSAGVNSEVDVADNVVSSGKNGTGNYWWGMDEHTFLPDECVVYWAPHTAISYVGSSANDRIDHFAVKSTRC